MRGYAGGSVFWYPLSTKTPIDVSYGFSHALLGGHYVFQLPPVKKILNESLTNHSLSDELFIARNISTSTALLLSILTIVLAATMLWLLFRFIKNFRLIKNQFRIILTPLLLTFIVYSAFFTFWMPEILEFWILQSVLLWLVLLGTLPITIKPKGIKPIYIYVSLATMLFVINYFGSIRWMQHKENDLYFVKASTIQKITRPKDLVILQSAWILKDFLKYFTTVNAQTVPLKDSSQTKIDSFFTNTLNNNGKVYILPEINNKMGVTDTRYIDSLRKQYSSRIKQFRDKDPEMWVIE
ncbi:MAG: hypothetical protein ACKVOW_11195 [Chitinophagaceae bacterium]